MLLLHLLVLTCVSSGHELSIEPVWQEVRILDDATGEPISGAQLWSVNEKTTPLTGEFWSREQFTSDEFGRVELPQGEEFSASFWWYLDAPGYAPEAVQLEREFPTVRLRRGRDVTVTLLNVFGDPVPDVTLGYILGCGHTPDNRSGVSDSNGRVVLSSIDPDKEAEWWPSGPGVLADYGDPQWNLERTEVVLNCLPAVVREGYVLDNEGKPMEGMFVGQPNRQRGPWCVTNVDGFFRLYGANEYELFIRDAQGRLLGGFPTSVEGVERRIVMGASQNGGAKLLVHVNHEDPKLVEDFYMTVVRLSDGWNTFFGTDKGGDAEIELRPGKYRVLVGEPLGPFQPLDVAVEVKRRRFSKPLPIQIDLVLRPTVEVQVEGLPVGTKISLATKSELRIVTRELSAVSLPDEPCVLLWYTATGQQTYKIKAQDREPGAVIKLTL